MRNLNFIALFILTGTLTWPVHAADNSAVKTEKPAEGKTAGDKPLSGKPQFEKKAGKDRERPLSRLASLPADEKARLKELYARDQDKFRQEMRNKLRDWRHQESARQLSDIAEKYHKTQNAEEKRKYLSQLKEASQKEFYRNLERSKTELDELEKRLNKLRQAYDNRKNNAEKIIDDQIEYLTRDPSLHW